MRSLFDAAGEVLLEADVARKLAFAADAAQAFASGELAMAAGSRPFDATEVGRPARPALVPPARLKRRGMGSAAGRMALMHAVAHIEFNAVNLAWDAVYRFRDMPERYYRDWLSVAVEEARHFRLVCDYLEGLDCVYGDLPAHDGLWQMAIKTADDVVWRMALVPRVLEARGLDVTPAMIDRMRQAGDQDAVSVLEVILAEEVGHVAIGSRWYHYACEEREIDPVSTFEWLLKHVMRGVPKPPFHYAARQAAGFTAREMRLLERMNES